MALGVLTLTLAGLAAVTARQSAALPASPASDDAPSHDNGKPSHHNTLSASQSMVFAPRVAAAGAVRLTQLNTTANGRLSAVRLSPGTEYTSGSVRVLELSGTAKEAGRAYAELVGTEAVGLYEGWIGTLIPPGETGITEALLDWLWRECLRPHAPQWFLDEVEVGMAGAEGEAAPVGLSEAVLRMMTLSNLPADPQNVERMLALEVARHGLPNLIAADGTRRTLTQGEVGTAIRRLGKVRGRGFCDYYAAWGTRTEDGRLLSSRNLDWNKGMGKAKLVTVYTLDNQTAYATFGYIGFVGALAGMSHAGITVSQTNLDNAMVNFDGIAWPVRLRQLLAEASTLEDAETLWSANSNTAAFNFLVGASASQPPAVALEAIGDFTARFHDDDPVEAAATYHCDPSVNMDGTHCTWPGSNATVQVGTPLKDAVWRSNHALHPRVMKTQEALWNDTVFRYDLIHDSIASSPPLSVLGALNITALLGIKGESVESYFRCTPADYAKGSNILSVTYDPSRATAYVAWEDGEDASWAPAACNTYLEFDFVGLKLFPSH